MSNIGQSNNGLGVTGGGGGGGVTFTDGTLLYWGIGIGSAGAYVPTLSDATYAASGVSINLDSGTWSRDGNGYLTNTATGKLLFTLPAKTTTCRRWIYHLNGVIGVNPNRWHFMYNYVDTSNHWYTRIMDTTNDWSTEIYEMTSGVENQRSVDSPLTTVNMPTRMVLVIEDWGDVILSSTSLMETDALITSASADSSFLKYYAASRNNKTGVISGIDARHGTSKISVSSIQIMDVPDV